MIYFGKNLYNNQVRCFDYFRKITCFLVLYTLQHHDCFQDFSIISCQECFLLLRQINSQVLVIFHSSSIGRANYQTRHKWCTWKCAHGGSQYTGLKHLFNVLPTGRLIFTRFMWPSLKSFSNRRDLFLCPVLNLEDCLLILKAHLYLSILGHFSAMIAMSTMDAQNPFHPFSGIHFPVFGESQGGSSL